MPKTDIQIIDPTKYKNWDDLLLTNPRSSFFHTAGWARVLQQSYGYRPLYFTRIENERLTNLLAVMEIDSRLTGKRGVSLPFTDHCPLIAKDADDFEAFFSRVVDFGKKQQWKGLEIRGGNAYLADNIPSDTFNTHVLDISSEKEDILSTFRDSTRRNINRARKKQLSVKVSQSLDAMKSFYRLNCLTRKDHGLPPQPFSFFKNFFDHIIATGKGVVVLACQGEADCVAGAIFSMFNKKVIFKYGASDKKYHALRPNNLVMWEAIAHYSQNGCTTFDFGRTDLDHKGLLQFKRGWGTKEGTIHYYNYDFQKNAFVNRYPRIKSSYSMFRRMPMPMLKLVGRVLYRHVG